MRIFYIRHLRVSRAWHDMTHCGQAKFLLAVTSGGQHGGAKPPDLDVLLVQGDLHRHSTFFRSFHIISQRFSTSEREVLSTVAHIDKTSCVCWAAAALDFASYRNSSSDKHLEFGGLLIWLGVQGAHSQREECRNDDERWETQVGYDMPWFHHNLKCQKPQLKSDTLTYESQRYNFAWLVQWQAVNYTMSVDK